MKKSLMLFLFIAGAVAANAQIKPDSLPLKKITATSVIANKNNVTEQMRNPNLISLNRPVSKKDLAISDLKVQLNSQGNYKISCKISNVGNCDINMADNIGYLSNCNGTMPMYWKVIHCYVMVGDCNNDSCKMITDNMLVVEKPDGTQWNNAGPLNSPANVIKPGETFIAARNSAWTIKSSYPSSRCGNTMTVTLVLDPLNKMGDQNLSNNKISTTVPYQ